MTVVLNCVRVLAYLVGVGDHVLLGDVVVVVGQGQVDVVADEGVVEVLELVPILRVEVAVAELLKDSPQLGVLLDVAPGVVALGLEGLHLVDLEAEDEDVLLAHLLGHLHVGAVQGADGQGTVELQKKEDHCDFLGTLREMR